MAVKRYSPYITDPDLVTLTVEAKLGEHPQGKYVLASDYDALAELLKLVLSDPGNWLHSDLLDKIEEVVGEAAPYRSIDDSGLASTG
jgi:hypothetical protein